MDKRRARQPTRKPIALAWRWWLEIRSPGGKWVAVGTVGTRSAAAAWLMRFAGRGGVQIRKPPALVASLAVEG